MNLGGVLLCAYLGWQSQGPHASAVWQEWHDLVNALLVLFLVLYGILFMKLTISITLITLYVLITIYVECFR